METADELTVREGYAAWAACYDEDGNPLMALEGPAMRAGFGPLVGRRALDLGCGTGRHSLTLAEVGARVMALDASPEMLARALGKVQGRAIDLIRHALPDPLPFRGGTFGVAVLGLVAEHLDAVALGRTLAEVARVLEPGGRLLLSALHPERTAEGQRARFIDPETGLRRPIATHHRTIADYLDAAAAAGLTLLEERTLVVPSDLADRLPRARRYLGRPLGWWACWTR